MKKNRNKIKQRIAKRRNRKRKSSMRTTSHDHQQPPKVVLVKEKTLFEAIASGEIQGIDDAYGQGFIK